MRGIIVGGLLLSLTACVNDAGVNAVAAGAPYATFESSKPYAEVVKCVGLVRLWSLPGALQTDTPQGHRWRYQANGSDVLMADVIKSTPVRIEWRQNGSFLGAGKSFRTDVGNCA